LNFSGLLPCTIKRDGGILITKVVVVEVKLVDITKSQVKEVEDMILSA